MNDRKTKNHPASLSPDELQRYARHLTLPQLGEDGQLKLKQSRLLIVGAGGLGSPAAIYLAAAGVGTIGIVDSDQVEASNLQRQILHSTDNVGNRKTDSAKEQIAKINPHVSVQLHPVRLTEENADSTIKDYDLVVDGSDNFPTRYLVNDTCHFQKKPWVYGSIYQFEGQVSVFGLKDGPCYRCLYPSPPPPEIAPDCSEAGVLGVLPGVIGSLQATEAIKLLTGIGQPLSGRVLYYDALEMSFRILSLQRETDCPLCGSDPTITSIRQEADVVSTPTYKSSVAGDEVDPNQLKTMMESDHPPLLIDVREDWEHALCDIGDTILIPVKELPKRLDEIPRDRDVVLFCRSGTRTRHALDRIKELPSNVCHLKGGIHAWSDIIDPTIPKY